MPTSSAAPDARSLQRAPRSTRSGGPRAGDLRASGGARGALGRVIVVERSGDASRCRGVVAAANGEIVMTTASVTAALLAAIDPSDADAVVVCFSGVDRFADDWAGYRLVDRLASRTDARVLAWVPSEDVDGEAFARDAGATSVVRADVPDSREAELIACWLQRGAPPVRIGSAEGLAASFAPWFAARFGHAWAPWMEQAAATIASGSDSATQAELCSRAWGQPEPATARARLRQLRATLCGEVRDEPALERRLALEVLRVLGQHVPIHAETTTARSLTQAAAALRAQPALIDPHLITERERADLLEVATTEAALTAGVTCRPGRPVAGAWRARRHHAIGRVASQRAETAADKSAIQAALAQSIDATLLTVHDALDDASRTLAT